MFIRTALACILLPAAISLTAHAQKVEPDHSCTLNKDVYTCDRDSFIKSLKAATTVAVDTQGTDHTSPSELKKLIYKLNKTPQQIGSDLTFLLIPMPNDGINVGFSGTELATLRVYGPAPQGVRGQLLWVETFTGTADLPWPAVVHNLIQQFYAKFK